MDYATFVSLLHELLTQDLSVQSFMSELVVAHEEESQGERSVKSCLRGTERVASIAMGAPFHVESPARGRARTARQRVATPRDRALPVIPHPDDIMADNAKTLADLLDAFAATGTSHVLIGGLVAGLYGKARATVDVDMLIPKRAARKVRAELERRGYRVVASEDMMRLYRDSEEPVADLDWQEAHPLLKAAATHTTRASVLGHEVRLVTRGSFVALKFHAAVSPRRAHDDKMQDVTDIARVIAKSLPADQEALAVGLARHAYAGAGVDLAKLIDDLRNNRPVTI